MPPPAMWTSSWTTWWTKPLPPPLGRSSHVGGRRHWPRGSGEDRRVRLPGLVLVGWRRMEFVLTEPDESRSAGTPSEAMEFVRFCYARRPVSWPQLYDEMSAVAGRGFYRGWGYTELAEHGIRLRSRICPDSQRLWPPLSGPNVHVRPSGGPPRGGERGTDRHPRRPELADPTARAERGPQSRPSFRQPLRTERPAGAGGAFGLSWAVTWRATPSRPAGSPIGREPQARAGSPSRAPPPIYSPGCPRCTTLTTSPRWTRSSS